MHPLNVLVLGAGGREHAIVKACLRSPIVAQTFAAPGNGGICADAPCHPVDPENPAAVVNLARALNANFVIVGPEAPLAAGVGDALRAAGFPTYGPNADGARLEASKAHCKAFFDRYHIPTARWQAFSDPAPAIAFLDQIGTPCVVKASGLAAGKGVLICDDRPAALDAIHSVLTDRAFGDAGATIVIEEFLQGEEASIMVMIGRDQFVCLPPSQDHKRVGVGDTGPNTGGMGAYAPAAIVDDAVMATVKSSIIEPTLRGFAAEGIDFRGTLFIGLMIHDRTPKVLEFNVRFGDPECQVLLPLCKSDPVALMFACATATLQPADLALHDAAAMIVVLAANGYPGPYAKNGIIHIPAALPDGADVIHAGTRRDPDGTLRANGGRVLGAVACAPTLQQAAAIAYQTANAIQWPDKFFRTDIGHRQLHR